MGGAPHLLLEAAAEVPLDELPGGGPLQLQVPLQGLRTGPGKKSLELSHSVTARRCAWSSGAPHAAPQHPHHAESLKPHAWVIALLATALTFERIFLKILFIQREEKGGRKRETSVCGCLSYAPYWRPELQVCALTGNQKGDPLVHRPALNH